MDHFRYIGGRLHGESVDLSDIADRIGTPTYVYSTATLLLHFDRIAAAFAPLKPLICFSVKSCPNTHILRLLVGRGGGLDVVSGGEMHRASLAGCPRDRIVFAGVGKSEDEIRAAIGDGRSPPALLNIESEGELECAARLAAQARIRISAALRINPDVDARTHRHTTTGVSRNKFGIPIAEARAFFKRHGGHEYLRLEGLHVHLGSPISEVRPYVEALQRILALRQELASDGAAVRNLNLGGGFAADYQTGASRPATEYAAAMMPLLGAFIEEGGRIILEPGRSIAANAGVLLVRVRYVKVTSHKRFIICDGGMHTLVRPALYEAFHFIWPTVVDDALVPERREEAPLLPGLSVADVVGPVCESSDFLALDRALPAVRPGQVLSVFTAGAYGASMSSRYNSHPLPAEVLIDGSEFRVIRRRESLADLVSHENA